VKEGLPTFYYNFFSIAGYRAQSSIPLPNGKSTCAWSSPPKRWGTESLPSPIIRECSADRNDPRRTDRPVGYSGEGLDIGADNISAVSPDYKSPFPFGGRIQSVYGRRGEKIGVP
jgi:hypothetical protein